MFQSIPITSNHITLAVHDHMHPWCLQAIHILLLTSALWIHSSWKYGTASSDFYKIPCDIIFQHCNRVSQSKIGEISGQLPYLVEREGERVLPHGWNRYPVASKTLDTKDVWHSRRKEKTMYLCQWEEEIQKLEFIEGGAPSPPPLYKNQASGFLPPIDKGTLTSKAVWVQIQDVIDGSLKLLYYKLFK